MLLCRVFFQTVAIAMGPCFLMLIPNRENVFAKLGSRTLAPYLLHWYVVFSFAVLVSNVPLLQAHTMHVCIMAVAAALCVIFFHPVFALIINRIAMIWLNPTKRILKLFGVE